ncbi:MAG: hypothetical protein JW775_00970, partial [Candidatus Aminicenantes bacterium]|nr:hypothetical protein [Candidatus Aminicenantes bacterium]
AIALIVATAGAFGQAKPDILGTWTGYTYVGDGSRFDFVLTVAKGEEGLTAKIGDTTGMMTEIICRAVAFADNKLTFELDYPEGMDLIPIKVALTLDGDSLKGAWTDPDGSQDLIEMVRK